MLSVCHKAISTWPFSLPGSLAQQHPLQPDKAVGPNQHHPRDTHDGGVCDHSRPSRPQRRRHAFSEGGAGLLHRLTVRPSTQQRGPRIGSTAMALGNRCALPQRRQRQRSGTRQEFGEAVRDRSGRLVRAAGNVHTQRRLRMMTRREFNYAQLPYDNLPVRGLTPTLR